jgi:DNA-binding NtrC family response regulator
LSSDSGAGQSLHGYSASENSSEGEQGEPVVARAATPQLKLALVEDREVLAASLRLMLDRSGFDASVFRTAEELLDSTSLGEFDLVITDVELPGINGFVLVEELRATRPELKFVLMSGHRQPDLSPLHQHPNTTRFIPKPFSFDALLQVISSLTGKPVASGSAK